MKNTNAIEDIIFTICNDITQKINEQEEFSSKDKYILCSFLDIICETLIENVDSFKKNN